MRRGLASPTRVYECELPYSPIDPPILYSRRLSDRTVIPARAGLTLLRAFHELGDRNLAPAPLPQFQDPLEVPLKFGKSPSHLSRLPPLPHAQPRRARHIENKCAHTRGGCAHTPTGQNCALQVILWFIPRTPEAQGACGCAV